MPSQAETIAALRQQTAGSPLDPTVPPAGVQMANQWANTAGAGIGQALGITDAMRALRGEMTPEEQQSFFMQSLPGLIPEGKGVAGASMAALHLLPRTLLGKIPIEDVTHALFAGKSVAPELADNLYGHGEPNAKSFDIANDQGQKVARMWTAQHNPNDLYVNYIAALDPKSGAIANATGEAANVLGTREMRSLIPELKKQFPDVNTVGGFRVSGARAANPSSTILKLK